MQTTAEDLFMRRWLAKELAGDGERVEADDASGRDVERDEGVNGEVVAVRLVQV